MPPFEGFTLTARRGGLLMVLIIARISTIHQDKRSLADQIALCEKYVRDRYPGPVRFVHIQSQGSGEILDRRELAEAEAAVESANYDLVVVEDLGRICRRNRAVDFCELCEDASTRLVAINDSIDTAREDWQLNAFFASFKHESSNKDTSKRIRRSLRNRFTEGGVLQILPFGYVKPAGANSDSQVFKDPAAAPIYDEWFTRLEDGASYCEVADWLRIVAPGVEWNGVKVARITHNPILKGLRRRNMRKSRRINKSGHRRTVKADPSELLVRPVPHLAFLDPPRYDRVIAMLVARNACFARGRAKQTADSRVGISRKRTIWPGQHIACGICGRLNYWGGHGTAEHMMCSGARDHRCWNGGTFDGHLAGRRIAQALLSALESLPEFDDALRDEVTAVARAGEGKRVESRKRIDGEVDQVERELRNLTDALARMGYSESTHAAIRAAEHRKALLHGERAELERHPSTTPEIPSVGELRSRARALLGDLDFGDPALGRALRVLLPKVLVFPYRLVDSGAVVQRAVVTVNLLGLTGPGAAGVAGLLTRELVVDLFDPPQRVAHRERIRSMRGGGLTERLIARKLGLTVTAVQRAMALHRRLEEAGLSDPYQLLREPPASTRLRRHCSKRYRFEPLDGYPAFPLPSAS